MILPQFLDLWTGLSAAQTLAAWVQVFSRQSTCECICSVDSSSVCAPLERLLQSQLEREPREHSAASFLTWWWVLCALILGFVGGVAFAASGFAGAKLLLRVVSRPEPKPAQQPVPLPVPVIQVVAGSAPVVAPAPASVQVGGPLTPSAKRAQKALGNVVA